MVDAAVIQTNGASKNVGYMPLQMVSHLNATGLGPAAYGMEISGGNGGTFRTKSAGGPSTSTSGSLGASKAAMYNGNLNTVAASPPAAIASVSRTYLALYLLLSSFNGRCFCTVV